ncbi:hypothetical protein IHE29_16080 (plasmid) [Mycetohabitans rhizoxinica]|uniref:Uncharacterized protein n=1 Tax=Mycetohabitans rhizoxinica TaxID=412963 RepID=A0ABZ2PZW0_9BURK
MDHRIPLSSINVGASTSSAPPSISQRSTAPLQGTPRSTPSALSGLCCLSRSSSTETNGSVSAEETQGQSIGQSVLSGMHSCITSCLPSLGPNLSSLTPEQRSEYYCNLAANYARRSAERDSNGDLLHKKENEELTSKGNVCWDAVKDCAFKAGAIPKNRYKSVNAKTDLVTLSDTRIKNANELESVPPGRTLGFFAVKPTKEDTPRHVEVETEPFHVMLTTGDNKAAGHKNGCIEIGNPSGWEELSLSQLKWHEGYFITSSNAKGKELDPNQLELFHGLFRVKNTDIVYQPFVVTHRPISEAGKQPSNEASTSAQV